jgi:hypothetical protein
VSPSILQADFTPCPSMSVLCFPFLIAIYPGRKKMHHSMFNLWTYQNHVLNFNCKLTKNTVATRIVLTNTNFCFSLKGNIRSQILFHGLWVTSKTHIAL